MHLGVYHFAPKKVAFRNDYCRACQAPRLAIRVRTFDALHVYWVPILPLGFWHRWHCTDCGRPPSENTRTRQGIKIAGAIALLPMIAIFWIAPVDNAAQGEAIWFWGGRILLPLLLAWTIYQIRKGPQEPGYKEKLAEVEPYLSSSCPFCQTMLFNIPKWHCPTCGLERK